jgi:hypothetical protein
VRTVVAEEAGATLVEDLEAVGRTLVVRARRLAAEPMQPVLALAAATTAGGIGGTLFTAAHLRAGKARLRLLVAPETPGRERMRDLTILRRETIRGRNRRSPRGMQAQA